MPLSWVKILSKYKCLIYNVLHAVLRLSLINFNVFSIISHHKIIYMAICKITILAFVETKNSIKVISYLQAQVDVLIENHIK